MSLALTAIMSFLFGVLLTVGGLVWALNAMGSAKQFAASFVGGVVRGFGLRGVQSVPMLALNGELVAIDVNELAAAIEVAMVPPDGFWGGPPSCV